MNGYGEALTIVDKLRSNQHDIANYLVTASLTLELCGSARNMTGEDYDILKSEMMAVLMKLQKSQSELHQLLNMFNDNEICKAANQ
jgi:hypothetical protein